MSAAQLEVGREMDAEIAVKVFCWKVEPVEYKGEEGFRYVDPTGHAEISWTPDKPPRTVPNYSTNVGAAFMALDALGERVTITHGNEWTCKLGSHPTFWADTLPAAICLAILDAVEVKS